MIITIDGPAGVGKSSLAKLIADHYGCSFISSGNVYRAISYGILKNSVADEKIDAFLTNLNLRLDDDKILLDGIDVTDDLHNLNIDYVVPRVANNQSVRNYVDKMIINFCLDKKDVVVEGRNMGIILKDVADVKFFLDADVCERAKRRFFADKQNNGAEFGLFEQIKQNIQLRDEESKNRSGQNRLQIPKDANFIDTTETNLHQVFEKSIDIIEDLQKPNNTQNKF